MNIKVSSPSCLDATLIRRFFLLVLGFCLYASNLKAQGWDLKMVVLIDSSNPVGYNTNATSPGAYQMGPERYLVNLQIPYRIIDVSKTAATNLTGVQLILSAQSDLGLGPDWQNAITAAVASGTGFVNLDDSSNIGQQTHIQSIFGATGATVGGNQTSIVVPAAVQAGGSTPHYIAALQRHWTGDPAGDLIYPYHGNGVTTITSNATLLTGGKGTVVARLGTDPLIMATTYVKGRAVDFTTCEWMHPDRFGFSEGVDDLFWRSLVWAARKPFVVRGYPRIAAIQLDDNEDGIMSRIPDMWNTTLTGVKAADGTGGPWNPQVNAQLNGLESGSTDRAQMITAIQAGRVRVSPHGLNYGSGGDLYWNLTVPNTDALWKTAVAAVAQWKAGTGGSDTFPAFSKSMVGHYWDISNNAGYDMWTSLGLRYITTAQAPGVYYWTAPKTSTQRLPYGPFRIYEQPPIYGLDEQEQFPFFYADDVTVGSVAGKPAQTFFAFGSQVGLSNGRFSRPDALFPSTQNGYSVAQSLNQWEYYMWRFWSGMQPVQIYTHDGDNLQYTTTSDRQSFIKQFSQWFSTNHGQHYFMDQMGDYLRARNHSLLSNASIVRGQLTLGFTGASTDANGALVGTNALLFYGDDEGTLLTVPGFRSATNYNFNTTQPATMQVIPLTLSFSGTSSDPPASQTITINNVGTGAFTWTASSTASWLKVSAASGASNTTTTASVNVTGLAAGSYTAALTFTAGGALNSPITIPVALSVPSITDAIVPSPANLTFSGFVGGSNPAPLTVYLSNPSGTSFSWTATSASPWLSAAVGVAGVPGSAIVSVRTGALAAGNYAGYLILKPTTGTATPATIPVTFQVAGPVFTPSTSSLSAWTVSPLGLSKGWTSSSGALQYSGIGESQLYAGNATWTDYYLDVNLTLNNLLNYPGGIRARVNPMTGAGYAVWMYPADHSLILFKVVAWDIDAGYTILASTNTITFTTTPHTLRIGVQGSLITVSLDGVQELSATDSTYTSGLIALDPSSQPIAFSSVVVQSSLPNPGTFAATPSALNFAAVVGAASIPGQTVTVTATPASVGWSGSSNATWLTVTPPSGVSTPATLTANVSSSGLAAGVYSAVLTLTPSTGTAIQIPVIFTLTSSTSTATLVVTPASVDLFGPTGSSPPAVAVSVQNTGSGEMPWTASSNSSWMIPTPTSSTVPGALTLTPSTAGLPSGNSVASVTVTAAGAAQSPTNVALTAHLGTSVLSDTFAPGDAQWTLSPLGLAANWTIANNAFNYSGAGQSQQFAGSQGWTNYVASADVTLSNLNDYPGGLRGRVNLTTGAAYAAWIYPAEHVIKLWRSTAWNIDNSGLTLLGQSPTITFDTKAHSLRLLFAGSQIYVYYDNAQIVSATDATLPSGAVALDVSSQPISFSNVIVLQQP